MSGCGTGCECATTECSCCPVGTVAIYDENGNHAGCVTPQEATTYNNDKLQCAADYGKLIDPNSGEFIGCVLIADLPATLTALEAATLFVGLSYTNVSCNGDSDGSATVAVSGGTAPYTITWTDDALTPVDPATLPVGAYILTVVDAAGVTQVKYFNITEPAVLSGTYAIMYETAPGAADGKAEVFAAGGTAPYTYATTKDGFSWPMRGNIIESIGVGTWVTTITDANGCTAIVNVI